MKKILSILLLSMVVLFTSNSAFANEQNLNKKEMVRQRFEQRLQLTNKQKEKAKVIHQKGMEQMKPVITQMESKRKELDVIKKSDLSEEAKEEQINIKREEIKALNKQAHEIRKQNSQEFEKILTKKQKKELDAMKAEGRARFEKKHPPRPPFQGFNTHGFLTPQRLFPTVDATK